MKWLQTTLLNTVMFLALAGFFSGLVIDTWQTALMAALVFGILNAIIKPILVILSLPLTILTLGLFYFIVNGAVLYMTSYFVSGFYISSLGWATFLPIIISLVNSLFVAQTDIQYRRF